MIVADTNLISYFFIRGEHTAAAEAVFKKEHRWVAPLLWRSEFRNVLSNYVRTGQMEIITAIQLTRRAEALLGGREYQVESAPVLMLASTSGCSAYDCEFVFLAQAHGHPLVTADKKVLKAFPRVAVSLEDYVR